MTVTGPRVVVLDGGYDSYEIERSVLAPLGAEVLVTPCHGSAEKVMEVGAEADALLVRESPIPSSVIERLQRCRVIVRYGVGTDNIDIAQALDHGIQVANVPDYGVEEVSEHALALLLALKRRLFFRDRAARGEGWGDVQSAPIRRTRGMTLGLIGCGRIGEAFLRKAMPLGFERALVFDRSPTPSATEAADVEQICREADVISLHLPLTEETKNILDSRRLALMKPGSLLINTARGGLADEAAVAQALREERLGGAGFDVFVQEPPPPDNPLLQAPNCILSDHAAWYSEDAISDLQRKAAEEIYRGLTGAPLRNPVQPARKS